MSELPTHLVVKGKVVNSVQGFLDHVFENIFSRFGQM